KESSSLIDVVELMTNITNEARKSLDKTPELLPILKEVGVVDSGGKGLLVIYEGFLAALTGKTIQDFSYEEKDIEDKIKNEHEESIQSYIDIGSFEHGYCTEFMIDLNKEKIESNSFEIGRHTSELQSRFDIVCRL